MKLMDYVTDARNPQRQLHSKGLPLKLELPDEIVKDLKTLYKSGETEGVEIGLTAFVTTDGGFKIDHWSKGFPDRVQTLHTDDNDAFGDLHSHPSTSIGHVHGYCAHSPGDYQMFSPPNVILKKPLFIRLVCSEKHIYAVIYRNGLSKFNRPAFDDLQGTQKASQDSYFEEKNPLGDKWRDEQNTILLEGKVKEKQLAGLSKTAAEQKRTEIRQGMSFNRLVELKKYTPHFGRYMMNASLAFNMRMASACGFGFYVSGTDDSLTLLAGPKE